MYITESRLAERRIASVAEQEARRTVVDDAIHSFRESVEVVLKTVADSTGEMKLTANALAASSSETSQHAAGAVHTSNEASGNVETAASAAEELSVSIAEIGRQLGRASEVVGAAASESQSTNTDIAGLARAAQKIGDVVELI